MTRDEVKELHYITHVDNVASILKHGILSHNRASGLTCKSVALEAVQLRRRKRVPNGRPLHDYVNLYFNARNPMMFRVIRGDIAEPRDLAVLRVSPSVLGQSHVVIADRNASSDYVMFYASPDGLAQLDGSLVFAEYWVDDDPLEQFRKKSAICAEVLVPDCVPARMVTGVYVSGDKTAALVEGSLRGRAGLDIVVNLHIFFM